MAAKTIHHHLIQAEGYLISSGSEAYCHAYAAELCGTLSIYEFIDYLFSLYHIDSALILIIETNCTLVIDQES